MDKITEAHRSWNMSRIRSKDTIPELKVRKCLFLKRLRYRINYRIDGKPDIVFVSKKIAVFIHGCFWHGHKCVDGHIPKSNINFWKRKISQNKNRDLRNIKRLTVKGWSVSTIWECNIVKNVQHEATKIERLLINKSVH